MVGEQEAREAWQHASGECRDLDCRAHGRMLRRIRRLVLAVVAERDMLALTDRALEVNSDEVNRLRAEVKRMREYPDATPVLDMRTEDHAAEAVRYAEAVQEWYRWLRGPGRDERAAGWERAHTTLCPITQCVEHRNPFQRTRGTT
jgi:hypothetical protein